MKVDSKVLVAFLTKATLNGSILTCVLRNNKIWSRSLDNAVAAFAELKQDLGMTLAIKDSALLIKVLKSFDGEVILEKKENILKIYDSKREAEIVLAAEEFITNELKKEMEPEMLQYTGAFIVPASMFSSALENFKVIKAEEYTVKIEDKSFKVIAGKKGFDNFEEKTLIGEYAECKNRFSGIINDVFSQLEGNVSISAKSAYPVKFALDSASSKVSYYVAPLDGEE